MLKQKKRNIPFSFEGGLMILEVLKKFFTTSIIERVVVVLLKELVKRTDSKIDDKIFNEVFGQIKPSEK